MRTVNERRNIEMKIIQFFSKTQLEWMSNEGIEHDRENAYGNICGDILNIFGCNT